MSMNSRAIWVSSINNKLYSTNITAEKSYSLFKIEAEVTKSKHQASSNFARRMPEDIADSTGEKHPKFSYK
ncbi:uncharacterized protein RAG0_00472 [Rhynchosporium agropyri]|uniref:Uncharacterized protein n=1 Tax=Rhynchosporium agropyri TaxID=914238 RepID=A0A1E1JTF6_9HELO|nr:uncharacterized protein RAG0_00472 [Rhynchosporium agropyri]